jgi:hypothetical protein
MPGPFDYAAALKAVQSPGDGSAMASPGGIAGLMKSANDAGQGQIAAIGSLPGTRQPVPANRRTPVPGPRKPIAPIIGGGPLGGSS